MTTPRPGPGLVARRIAQYLLDALLVAVPIAVLAVLVAKYLHPRGFGAFVTFLKIEAYTVFVVWALAFWFITIWWPHRHGGRTPAMRWLKLRVVTLEGGQPPLRAFVIRALLMVVDGFCWGLAGVVIMLCTPRRQRLGDLVAGTVVVSSADEPGLPRPDGDLGAVASPQLALGGREVGLHGGERQDE
ncbi:RDD family protein [Amycolatopsis sp. NPDC051903]|uniref:RDD family protein n=1 Tax=Amycolatopsis sp. NPDC051903 TaxID=3363936 RepID=UPI0037B7959C